MDTHTVYTITVLLTFAHGFSWCITVCKYVCLYRIIICYFDYVTYIVEALFFILSLRRMHVK